MSYYKEYLNNIIDNISLFDEKQFGKIKDQLLKIRKNNKKVLIAGNGGSASMASHVSVDLTKVCKIRSVTFNEPNLITCFVNDFGQDNWVKEAIKSYYQKGDLVILISSSGNSANIVNAAKFCKKNKLKLITLSGFYGKNKLSKLGSYNLIVNSKNYNHIEMIHHIWLLMILDEIIEAKF